MYAANPDGIVTVKFKQEEPAQACIAKMNGRFFGGNQLVAHMWDGVTYYHVSGIGSFRLDAGVSAKSPE